MTFIFGSDLPVGETAEKDKMIWPGWRGCGTGMTEVSMELEFSCLGNASFQHFHALTV